MSWFSDTHCVVGFVLFLLWTAPYLMQQWPQLPGVQPRLDLLRKPALQNLHQGNQSVHHALMPPQLSSEAGQSHQTPHETRCCCPGMEKLVVLVSAMLAVWAAAPLGDCLTEALQHLQHHTLGCCGCLY